MTTTSSHTVRLGPRPGSFGDSRFLMFVLDEMAAAYEKRYDDVIRLTLGKVESPPADPVVDAMLAAARDPARSARVHPAGLPELRERLAVEYHRRHDVLIGPDRFVVSTGTSTMFRNLYQLLLEPGDEVVVPLPYYPLYVFTARLVGATVRYYTIDPVSRRVDLGSVEEAVTDRTRIVVVNSPGNPLGNVMTPGEFRRVDEIVAGRALLISDEIYGDVSFDAPMWSAAAMTADLRSPVVVTGGFSKAHRMYARRVGYAVVPPELVEPLTVVQHHTLLTTDPVPQFGAVAALDHPDGVTELRERYRARRDRTQAQLSQVPGVEPVLSQGGFYHTVDCAEYMRRTGVGDTLTLAERIMDAVRVATVPGSDFGLPTALRLSYTAHRYDEAIDRLVSFFTAAGE